MKDNKINWLIIVAVVVIVAVLTSLITLNLTGNVIKLNADRYGKNLVYTQAEVDAKLNSSLLGSFYFKNYNQYFNRSIYATYLEMACDMDKDIVISSFCSINPVTGGDNLQIGSSVTAMNLKNQPILVACIGPNYLDTKYSTGYNVRGSIICLKG